MPRISKIVIYDEPTVPEIQTGQVKRFIADTFSIDVESRENFFQTLRDSQETSEKAFEEVSSTRIFDLKRRFKRHIPTDAEIQNERKDRDAPEDNAVTLYDGFELQKVLAGYLPANESRTDILHVVFTDRLVCTFDEQDFRYHARALIGSNPAIISTSGIIEAPAKPRRYYVDMMTCLSKEEMRDLNTKYEGKFLRYHDLHLGEIANGYVSQAVMYYHTGEAFCKDRGCRLFNAHWQSDLFYSQIENKRFCKRHSDVIKKLGDKT